MAKLINNPLMQGVSGIIGKTLIFRQMKNGTTVIAMRPKPRTKPITPAEAATHHRFKEAAYIAKQRIQDPILKAQYLAKAKPGQSAYLVALTEYLNSPKTKQQTLKTLDIDAKKAINIPNKLNIAISKNAIKNRKQTSPLNHKIKPVKDKLHRRIAVPNAKSQNYRSKPSNKPRNLNDETAKREQLPISIQPHTSITNR